MRMRKCKRCGAEFHGIGEQRLCAACRSAAKAATVVRSRVCAVCGCTFDGGPRATYCPRCREERAKKTNAEYQRRKAAHKTRTLGSIDLCQVCGKEYIVNSGRQTYCPDCAAEAVRQKVLPHKREYAEDHREDYVGRKVDLKSESAVCAYCGRTYTPSGPSVTCSPACAAEYTRICQGMADWRRGKRKTPPTHERYSSGLPQSQVVGVTFHRKTGKWQVTHNGKYIGLFSTQEEAETKKMELQPPD